MAKLLDYGAGGSVPLLDYKAREIYKREPALVLPSNPLTDTFLMARRQVLWPQLATSQTGTWAWLGSSNYVFGGIIYNVSNAANDALSWSNVNTLAGQAYLNLLTVQNTDSSTISVYFNGVLVGSVSLNGPLIRNHVVQIDLGVLPATRGTLEVRSSSGLFRLQQAELIQPSGSNLGASIDSLPWFGDVPPIMYSATSITPALVQSTAYQWGSRVQIASSQNSYTEYDVWLPQGNIELSMVSSLFQNWGIGTVALDGVDVGTLDFYGPSVVENQTRSCSFDVPLTGMHKLRITAKTKNASSGGYSLVPYWLSWRKTTATGAITPTGATYGRESMELWPWFSENSDWNIFQLNGNSLHYATMYNNTFASGDSQEWAHALKPGTYSLLTNGRRSVDYGNAHWSENEGADLAIVVHSGASSYAHMFAEASLPLIGGTIKRSADTSNGSPANHYLNDTMIRLVRTGD